MSNSAAPPNGIVYFHYPESPFARRVVWYLAFRKIAYSECVSKWSGIVDDVLIGVQIQPRIMPRPDLAALGVRYRKTPTMAIGRDVYVDSRMIIRRLEELFPPSEEHPAFSTKETAGLAGLLNKLNIDIGMFSLAVMMMPPDLPLLKDETFVKDRSEYFGGSFPEFVAKNRQRGLCHMRQCFDIVESLVVDKQWVGGTSKPTLADLEGKRFHSQ
jgi:glutathione S-transferase